MTFSVGMLDSRHNDMPHISGGFFTMNLAILALVTAIFSIPQIAHEQAPASPSLGGPEGLLTTSILEPIEVLELKSAVPEILAKISACESQDRHFNDAGGVLKGGKNKYDIGKYQINVLYWGELADEIGQDIYTEEGNEAVALEIYNRHGTAPWKWSKQCWNK